MEEKKRLTEPNTPQPDPRYKIKVMAKGPYLVYGNPPLSQEILVENNEHTIWKYESGQTFSAANQPTPLCTRRMGVRTHRRQYSPVGRCRTI